MSEAQKVLSTMNPNAKLVEEELYDIKLQVNTPSGGFKELFGPMARPVLIMALGLAIFQQVMGCNTVLYMHQKYSFRQDLVNISHFNHILLSDYLT